MTCQVSPAFCAGGHLIVYDPLPAGIQVARIAHAAQDLIW